jgi:hypothetical protein
MFDDWIDWIPGKRLDPGKDSGPDFRILNLTPGERASIEAVERKASKIGFICKLRLLYIAPHDIYSAKRVISSVFGGMKQFGDLTSNSFKPNKRTKTSAVYFFPEQRANARRGRILSNYRNRSWYAGSRSYILNTEELATLYHFPSISVTTPYLKRTDVKKSDAPAQLPAGLENLIDREENDMREQLEGLSLDNNYYERMYSKKAPTQANVDVLPHTPATSHLRDQLESLGAKEPANVPSNLPIIDEH